MGGRTCTRWAWCCWRWCRAAIRWILRTWRCRWASRRPWPGTTRACGPGAPRGAAWGGGNGVGVGGEGAGGASVGELADRILHFGPEDVERVARDVPEPLKRILHKALRPHPDDRYQSGGELRAELCAWQRTQGRRFGRAQAAAELRALVRQKPSPQDTRAFPLERGVLLTPEEAETARRKGQG